MRTRNTTPKSTPTGKKTPPAKKSSVKTPVQSSPAADSTSETATVKSASTPSSKTLEIQNLTSSSTDSKSELAGIYDDFMSFCRQFDFKLAEMCCVFACYKKVVDLLIFFSFLNGFLLPMTLFL